MRRLALLISVALLVGCQDPPPKKHIYCAGASGIKQFIPETFTQNATVVCNDNTIEFYKGEYDQ
jgi:hypothetical protein